jgi:hypothetical protein
MRRMTWMAGALLLFSIAVNAQQNKALQKANEPLQQAMIQLHAKRYTASMKNKLQLSTEQSVKIYTLRKQLSHYVYGEYAKYRNKPEKLVRVLKPHKEIFELGLKKTLHPEQYIAWNDYRAEWIQNYMKQKDSKVPVVPATPKQPVKTQPYILADFDLE